jgi:hypothetical protein
MTPAATCRPNILPAPGRSSAALLAGGLLRACAAMLAAAALGSVRMLLRDGEVRIANRPRGCVLYAAGQ